MTPASIARTLGLGLGLIAVTLTACDPEASDFDGQDRGEWSPPGKADSVPGSTCQDTCGEQAPAGCWCDDLCEHYGDCCPDKVEVCDCEPQACEELDVCGVVEDGCGGTLDCGPCCEPATCQDLDTCGEIDDGCGTMLDCGECPPPDCLPETPGWGPLQSLAATGTVTKLGDPSDTSSVTLSLEGYGALDCLERDDCKQTQVNGALLLPSGGPMFTIVHNPNQDRRAHWTKAPDGEVTLSARSAPGAPGPGHPGCPGSWLLLENRPGTSELVGSLQRYTPWHGSCELHRWDVALTLDSVVSCVPQG